MNAVGAIAAIAFGAGVVLGALATGGNPPPPQQTTTPERGHRLPARPEGNSCLLDVWANGSPLTMLLDTGAWDSLYFPAEIARRSLGIDLATLPTDHTLETFGRTVRGATVSLRSFRMGVGVEFHAIPALIDDSPFSRGLIGMGVLKERLHAQLDTDSCVLRW
jgi:predicted aspartyl protease